jgi:exodeoxyribonuclease VII small subunit
MSKPSIANLSFEDAYAQLEDIVTRLEAGNLPLEETVSLYERGQALARRCEELLEAAELHIRQIDDAGMLRPLDGPPES